MGLRFALGERLLAVLFAQNLHFPQPRALVEAAIAARPAAGRQTDL